MYVLVVAFSLLSIVRSLPEFAGDPLAMAISVLINGLVVWVFAWLKTSLFPFQNFLHTKKMEDGTMVFDTVSGNAS